MNELNAILTAWRTTGLDGGDAVLATVVHVTGSAYRRPGARMLIEHGGHRVGTISGGCLEGEVTKKAAWLTRSGRPVVQTYDTTADSQGTWEFGLGCNGVVRILLERVASPETRQMLAFVEASRGARVPAAIATVIACGDSRGVAVGERLMVDSQGRSASSLGNRSLDVAVFPSTDDVLRTRKSAVVHLGDLDLFVEFVPPPVPLVIFGAGDDARPLAAMAGELGWQVTIADGRPAYARADRFPAAERVVLLPRGDLPRDLVITTDTVVVMMTHNYHADVQLLPLIAARQPRYLGLLGPRARAEMLFDDAGIEAGPNVHAPIGLDIGGDTPASTALSIVAEIQAVLNGRDGGMLRDRRSAIHDTVLEIGAVAPVAVTGVRPSFCASAIGSRV